MQEILETAHSAFVSLDAGGRVTYWNGRAESIFEIPREEALGSELAELIVPHRYRERHREALRDIVSGGPQERPARRMHLSALRRDGREFPIELNVSALWAEDGWRFTAWIEDVSERAHLLGELEAQLRSGSPGMAEILDSLAEAVTIRDPHHHIVYANRAAIAHMGFGSLQELQQRPPHSIFADYVVQDEHGRELTMEDIPSVRLLAGEAGEPLLMRTVNRSTGALRWNLLKSTVLTDESGEPAAAVTIIEDVTREKTSELRDRFLTRATETLMSSLDYQETLTNVARLAVPEIADWCAVDLVDERGTRQHLVVAHSDPEKVALAEQLRRREPDELRVDSGAGRVMRTGMTELYAEVPESALIQAAADEEHLELLREVGFRSVLLVPLRARGRTLGVMTLVTAESMRRFDEGDREFAEQLASRAAVAVDNARLATARRQIAETLQRSLLPEAVPEIEGWEIATMYRPASESNEVEVGGDFYDFVRTDTGWLVLLGDVTGRGVEAASMTSLVRHGGRFLARQERSPSAILARLHQALREQPGLSLCSAVCMRLEPARVVLGSAGHPPPIIVRDDGRIRELGASGPLLGGWIGTDWADRAVSVGPDELLLLYTDGVTDTRGEEERFGRSRLRRLLLGHASESPAALLESLEAALDGFQAQGWSDDTAAVALRPLGTR